MIRRVEMDALIRDAVANNGQDFAQLAPDFERIEHRAIRRTTKPKWFSSMPARVAMVLALIFVAFTLGGILNGNASVQAFRHNALVMWDAFIYGASSNNGQSVQYDNKTLEQIQARVPIPIPVPRWLPKGFVFQAADLNDEKTGDYSINLEFKNDMEVIIVNYQYIVPRDNAGSGSYVSRPPEKMMVGNFEVQLFRASNKDEYSSAHFVYGNALITTVSVPYSVDLESLKKLILNIK